MAKVDKEFWEKQFAQISMLTGKELVNLEQKITQAQLLSNNVFSEKFIAAYKDVIASATQMSQILGVIQYTKRWRHGKPNKTGTETETD